MHLPRALGLAVLERYRLRIELDSDVFGEVDLGAAVEDPAFAMLRCRETFLAARMDAEGVVTWPCGLALDPKLLWLRLKLQQFAIGTEFSMSGGRWRCTDTGSRTVTAIKLEHDDDPSWYSGPPYAVAEYVIDESDLPACELGAEQLEAARARMLSGNMIPCASTGQGLLRLRADIRQPLWWVHAEGSIARLGRGGVVLEKAALARLAEADARWAAVLRPGSSTSSRLHGTRLHQLLDEQAHELSDKD
jgi:hypothetical protein